MSGVFSHSFRRKPARLASLCPAFAVLLLFSAINSLCAEEPDWVIAAEKFTASGVPKVYESFPEMIPRLILARISAIRERMVLPNEKEMRKLQELSTARFKLIRERSALILERDQVVLSSNDYLTKRRLKSEAKKKIALKDKEIAAYDKKIKVILDLQDSGKERKAKGEFSAGTNAIALWKNGKELYTRPESLTLANALGKDKISALVSGSVEDIAGYLYVTVKIDTGIAGMPYEEVSEAASYDDVSLLVSILTVRLIPQIANRAPVKLELSVEPADAQVYVDGKLVPPEDTNVTVFAGEHIVSVSAPGYESATKKARFEGADAFNVKIALQEEKTVTVSFDTGKTSASIFLNTRYYGQTPTDITLPLKPVIGEAVIGDVETWFVLMPDETMREGTHMMVKPNKTETGQKIDRRRNAFYWSLGALYLSLPVSMLSYGVAQDKYKAYNDGRMPQTDASVTEVNNWIRVSTISRGISLALGVNVIFQLVRYIVAANDVIPEFAQSESKK